jgi:deoxyribodipyrimidine photo-lyase
MIQSEKFDPDAKYIKEWLPELKNIPAKELHNWSDHYQKYDLKDIDYVKPIVDYKEARARSVKMYKAV